MDGILLHRRIGNVALVGVLRAELEKTPDRFPLLLSKVLYSGTPAGDSLSLSAVVQLEPELMGLAQIHVKNRESEGFVRDFENQMRELVECALHVGKPITF